MDLNVSFNHLFYHAFRRKTNKITGLVERTGQQKRDKQGSYYHDNSKRIATFYISLYPFDANNILKIVSLLRSEIYWLYY